MNLDFTRIGRFLFYIFTFLLPVFYIPGSIVPIEINKTLFLLVSLSIIAVFFIALAIKEGKLKARERIVSGSVLGFVLIASLSTLCFSSNLFNSFFGEHGGFDSLIAIISYGLVFFLAIGLNKKEEIRNVVLALISSLSIINIGFLGKALLGGEISIALGSLNILSILNVVGLVLLFFFFKEEENPSIKGLTGLAFFILGAGIVFINFNSAWFILAIASFLIFWGSLLKGNFKKINYILLGAAIISAVLFFLNPSFPFEKRENIETLSFSNSLEIVNKEGITALGFGASSFDEKFLEYNPSMLQDTIHFEASSTILTIFNDFGIIGLIIFLIPFIYAILKGFKRFLTKKQDSFEAMSFISLFILFVLLFFYAFDALLMSLLFLFLALFIACSNKGKDINFKSMSPIKIFAAVAILSLALMSLIILNYLYFLNYSAENYYSLAIKEYKNDREKAIEHLIKSESLMEKDKTLIGLSQLYLLKASDLYNQSRLLETKEEDREVKKEECEKFMQLSEDKAKRATEINSNDYFAWLNLGNIYNNRRYLRDEDLADKAIEAYAKAAELAPYTKEPYEALIQVYSELGNVEKREEYLEKIRVIDPNYL
ncbi:MAG: hypothetical protein PHY30_02195 [Candidatus Pacebacteria bacterium]|nr:hypothetical protein [Candidatus Paceibacterota bacterium]